MQVLRNPVRRARESAGGGGGGGGREGRERWRRRVYMCVCVAV